jgi:hypothetical protein
MSDLVRQILAELPNRAERSSLEPYQELIQEIRRRGYSYREISRLLEERCNVKISHAAIHNFVRRRRQMPGAEPPPDGSQRAGQERGRENAGGSSVDERDIRDRIAALKRRVVPSAAAEEVGFRFDPDQPLRLDDEQS